MERAARRLGAPGPAGARRRRSDRGVSRLDPAVLACVEEAASGRERPAMRELLARIADLCRARGLRPPARATVYHLLPGLRGATCRVEDLPPSVRAALYNLGPEGEVPVRQVAFCGMNYGDLAAMHFAAGLPWLAIYQALRMPGYRPKSRGLMEAVAFTRGI
jgi:hypothetical protein